MDKKDKEKENIKALEILLAIKQLDIQITEMTNILGWYEDNSTIK